MGIFKLMSKSFILIIVFILALTFNIYSKELTIDEFYSLTLKDAIDYSDNGNPIDVFLNFKKQNGGEVDTGYGDYINLNFDIYYNTLDEKIHEEENKIREKIENGEKEIVKDLIVNKNQNIKNYFRNNIIKLILLFICIVSILIAIIVLKNKILVIISSIIIVILIISLNLPSLFFNMNKTDVIIDSINNNQEKIAVRKPYNSEEINQEEYEEQLSKKKPYNDFEYVIEEEYIKRMCNKRYDVSWYINDYILKIYYCISQKAQNKPLNYNDIFEVVSYDELDKEREYVSKLELLDRNTFLNNNPNDFKINIKTLSFDEMKYIYENITDKDIEDYNNGIFINRIINEIEQKIEYIKPKDYENKDLLLSSYLVENINVKALCKKFFNDDILRVLKDWYIEDNTKVELPFNVKLNFEKQKFIKKDINEFLAVDKDKDNLYVYYKDSKGNIKGDFVLSEYIDSNDNFNKSELLYNIKRAILTIEVDGFKPFYNYEDINVYDENGKYLVSIDVRETIGDNMSRGTNRDMSLLYMLLMKHKSFAKSTSITDFNFTSKFNNKFQIQDNIYEILPLKISKVKVISIDKYIAKTDKLIRKLILEDGTEKICIFKVEWTDNYEVDDILTYIVPEDKMDLTYEEMYQLAFND